MKFILVTKGSDSSGDFGHAGRPGLIGGSAPRFNKGFSALLRDNSRWSISKKEQPKQGVSYSQRIHVKGDGDAIIKTESSLYDDKTTPWKEEDAYLTSIALGFNIVPVSVKSEGSCDILPGEPMSVQAWVTRSVTVASEEDELKALLDRGRGEVDYDSFEQVMWLDTVIGNTDRHGNNILVALNNKGVPRAVAIDNGLAFYYTKNTFKSVD